MDDPKDNLDETPKNGNNRQEQEKEMATVEQEETTEGTTSDASISEHINSEGSSVENDRSFQEIEVLNQPSALDINTESVSNISKEQQPNSLDLSSFDNTLTNGLTDNTSEVPRKLNSTSGADNAKSILEEILNNLQLNSNIDQSNSKEDSFNVFANVDLSDKSLINLPEATFDPIDVMETKVQLKPPDEIGMVKEFMLNALPQEMDSFREMSNPTCTSSMISATEYRQLQEECHNKLMEYNSTIMYKNDLIQKLSESLDQSVNERKELLAQVETFKQEIAQLQNTLRETSKLIEDHKCDTKKLEINNMDPEEATSKDSTTEMTQLRDQLAALKATMTHNKGEYETEITRLRGLLANIKCGSTELMELRAELEKKHTTEVEELRTYFEKKCVELEKNYSEEVFSQQSRKMSGSSSDADLSGDFLLPIEPGPGGDCENNIFRCKEDVEKFKEALVHISNKLARHCLEDIGDKGLSNIEIDVRSELNSLLRIGEKLEVKAIESKYSEEISDLRFQLDEVRRSGVAVRSAVQEVASSGDFELNELVESYERRLQQQIHLAKIDLINELEGQIQRLTSSETDCDEDWPSELLQLRDKFADKYKKEIEELNERHNSEISKLKDEHLKILNGALERARRRSSLRDGDGLSKGEVELLKERDSLKRQVVSLRNLLSELVQYFARAEDELNNTLVDNLLNQTHPHSDTMIEDDVNLDASSGATTNSSRVFDSFNKTRVHLAPNFGDLIGMVEHHSQGPNESLDISVDLKNELGMRLKQLRQEANAVLALTQKASEVKGSAEAGQVVDDGLTKKGAQKEVKSEEKRVGSEEEEQLTKRLIIEKQHRERLRTELDDSNEIIASLEKEKEALEQRLDDLLEKIGMLEADLEQSRYKIAELVESGRGEVVSEGYGEEGSSTLNGLEDTMKALSELQEKARTMLAHSRIRADPNLLQLIDELSRVGEKIKEEAKRESQDLLQQAENLEHQVQELTDSLADQQRINATHKEELDEALEKLNIFRDIIKELEQRSDAKDLEVQELLRNVEKLECIIGMQHLSLDDSKLVNSLGDVTDIQGLRRKCEDLEEEVQKLRIGAELAGSEGALKQIKIQLFEFETHLDKKTKELELLHSTGTSCSSPSEDMSVRDLVRPRTPTASSPMDECEVPLQQLARLKEKLVRHSRAEEAAIKRIHDLEMQVAALKTDLDEATNEKDFLKKQTHEQLVLISDFQIRLDEQRVKAEFIEKQTNTSLEMRIHDLQSENFELQDKLKNKEKLIQNQEKVIKETEQRVLDLEREITSGKDDELIVEMQKDLDALRHENSQLKTRASTDSQILPNLVENIIQDKNNELEKLRVKLTNAEKMLFDYTSLNLDKSDLKTLANLKNSGGSIEELISILDLSQPEQIRRYDHSRGADLSGPGQILGLKKSDEDTQFLGSGSEPEISEIERVGPSNLNYTRVAPLGKPNSTELGHKSAEKRVRFEDTINTEKLTKEIQMLKQQIDAKDKQIVELEAKLKILDEFETNITDLQSRLDKTEEALTKTTDVFKKEQEESNEREKKLVVELAGKKLKLCELEKEVQALREDSVRKDKTYFNLAREKRVLEQKLASQEQESLNKFRAELMEKDALIEKLQSDSLEKYKIGMAELEECRAKLDEAQRHIKQLEDDTNSLRTHLATRDQENAELINKNAHVSMDVDLFKQNSSNKSEEVKTMKKALADQESAINSLNKELKERDALVMDRDCDLEIMNEDIKFYQEQLIELENKVKSLQDDKNRQEDKLRISELTRKLAHAQDLMREKDRVIGRLREECNQVQKKIEIMNAQINDIENVMDLSNRLRAEQRKNADLHVEIHKLKARLMNYELADTTAVDAITGQLKRELECAAQIDSNILSAVSDQSLSSVSEGHDVQVYIKTISRQKSQNKQLLRQMDQLEKQNLTLKQQYNLLQLNLAQLQDLLDKEKLASKQALIEDAKLIEQLRIQLDGALDHREHLEQLLEQEKQNRRDFEVPCDDLKKPNSSSESTRYKSLPSQNALEVAHLKRELEQVKLEKEQLLREIKDLKQNNGQLESTVKYTREMLKLADERNRNQEEKFRVLSDKERNLSDELLRQNFQLERMGRELEGNKIKMYELEREKSLLIKQKTELLKALKAQPAIPPSENAINPETLEKVIRELRDTCEDNKRKLEYIRRIENEKRHLEQELRSEITRNANNNVPFDDLLARSNYLFAKTLKLESVKKILLWQKRYLVENLQSHQEHCLIEVLPGQPHGNYCLRRTYSPLKHFRSAVWTVIAIERMRFLVRRWHTGMRQCLHVNARHYDKSTENYLREIAGATAANFQVGQPVSTQNFSSNPFRSLNPFMREALLTADVSRPASPGVASGISDASWSGNSPPCKEAGQAGRRNNPFQLKNLGTIPPLQAPQLLTQLHQRIELIQEKLSIPFMTDHN